MIDDKFKELQTERLILRKINSDDAIMIFNNIYNNFEWYKFYYQKPFNNFEEYKQLVSKYKEWYSNGNHFRWEIVEKSSRKMIGLVQLHSKDDLNNNCKIGYIIGYQYNKKGYTKEAVKEVINFAFNILEYHRIEADIVEENTDSIKLAESLGMRFESIKRECYKLSIFENILFEKIKLDQKFFHDVLFAEVKKKINFSLTYYASCCILL